MAPAPRLTTDEYFRTPETLRPSELIYGALRVAESPTVRHQQAVGAFYRHLFSHVHDRRLGQILLSPMDVVLDAAQALVVQPDLLFVSAGRGHILRERVLAAPDMVLEVLSPNPRIGSLQERIDWFARYGVREIWLLAHLTERFRILRADGGRIVDETSFRYLDPIQSDVLPAFTSRVGEIVND